MAEEDVLCVFADTDYVPRVTDKVPAD